MRVARQGFIRGEDYVVAVCAQTDIPEVVLWIDFISIHRVVIWLNLYKVFAKDIEDGVHGLRNTTVTIPNVFPYRASV